MYSLYNKSVFLLLSFTPAPAGTCKVSVVAILHIFTLGESNSCDKFIFLITLQPSSSLLPAGSGSVLPIPFVEWRPGSSFSTYSACQMCSEFQKGTKMKTTVEQWGFSGCQHLKLSYDEDTLFRSYMLPRATSQRRRRPVLFLLLVEQ